MEHCRDSIGKRIKKKLKWHLSNSSFKSVHKFQPQPFDVNLDQVFEENEETNGGLFDNVEYRH